MTHPAPEKARVGRDLQRYSRDGERLLAGCVLDLCPDLEDLPRSLTGCLFKLSYHTSNPPDVQLMYCANRQEISGGGV